MFESRDPATGEVFARYEGLAPEGLEAALEACRLAQERWRRTAIEERAAIVSRAGALLRERRAELAVLMAREMGKPVREGRAEADKCGSVCDYYADNAARQLADREIASGARRSYVSWQPLGVVLAVMPWNFPLWQVFRFAAPALMAGNGGLLKHASNVPGCALAIEELLGAAGVPEGLFRTLLIDSAAVGGVIDDRRVQAVTLTGSSPAGRAVASRAGAALKKTVLELGGSDPYVVLADADLEATVAACVTSRLINGGQSCIAAKRFVVVRDVLEAFTERFVAAAAARRMGDPQDEGTDVGPLARHDLRDELHRQVERSVAAGARCLLGGRVPDSPGAFYPPTVLSEVRPGMPAYDEELFGPVAAIVPVADAEEAVAVANDTVFGLGAAVFSRDVERAERIARERLEAGSCFVNDFVRSDPRLPFGGIKESGYGRELSDLGIREFVNAKTVWLA